MEICPEDTYTYAPGGKSAASAGFFQWLCPPGIVLVANTPRTIIRAEKLNGAGKKLTPKDKWALVKKAFPLGRLINEESHVFDGCVYKGTDGSAVFLMAALPLEAADEITRAGITRLGKKRITRLDTIENMLFRRFCAASARQRKQWVVFPQGEGLRVLAIAEDKTPSFTHDLTNAPALREGALLRLWEADAPKDVILLSRRDWAAYWDDNREWVSGWLTERGARVRNKNL
jgi:hypothetical protein